MSFTPVITNAPSGTIWSQPVASTAAQLVGYYQYEYSVGIFVEETGSGGSYFAEIKTYLKVNVSNTVTESTLQLSYSGDISNESIVLDPIQLPSGETEVYVGSISYNDLKGLEPSRLGETVTVTGFYCTLDLPLRTYFEIVVPNNTNTLTLRYWTGDINGFVSDGQQYYEEPSLLYTDSTVTYSTTDPHVWDQPLTTIGYHDNGVWMYNDNIVAGTYSTGSDLASALGIEYTLVHQDVVVDLYPVWDPNIVKIKYRTNGGTTSYPVNSNGEIINEDRNDTVWQEVPYDGEVSPYSVSFFNLQKEDYEFVGWALDGETQYPLKPGVSYSATVYNSNVETNTDVECYLEAVWRPLEGKMHVNTDTGWKSGKAWVLTNTGWKQGRVWTKTTDSWK